MQVMQVDIGMYDSDWQERHGGKESRISTFTDLAMELVKPYGAVRAPERFDLTEEQTFWALTGEDRNLLLRGKLVSAKVIWVKKDLAGLVTDNGTQLFCPCSCFRAFGPHPGSHALLFRLLLVASQRTPHVFLYARPGEHAARLRGSLCCCDKNHISTTLELHAQPPTTRAPTMKVGCDKTIRKQKLCRGQLPSAPLRCKERRAAVPGAGASKGNGDPRTSS